MNLIEGIQEEQKRNRELLEIYKSIPTGGFGALMIRQALDNADKAIASGDVTEMIRVYKDLKNSK